MGSTIGWVALGGALGATGRYLVSTFAVERWGVAFPYGTLIVNVAGSLLLGVVAGIFARGTGLPESVRLLVGVGFCGAFTTFSTFAVETVGLADRPSLSTARCPSSRKPPCAASGSTSRSTTCCACWRRSRGCASRVPDPPMG